MHYLITDNTEDCATASKNGDMDKVLETCAQLAKIYLQKFPARKVYFRGSDEVRSRKYQIGIRHHLNQLLEHYIIEGILIDEYEEIAERGILKSGKNYDRFIFGLKKG